VLVWTTRQQRAQQQDNLQSQLAILDNYKQLLAEAGNREERLIQLMVSKDPMTFQALTAVIPTAGYDEFQDFDPSDEGEISRIAERNPLLAEDPVNEFEQSFVSELGLDAEFFGSNETSR
jgi:hypothetical protein